MAILTAQQVRDRARSDDISDTDVFTDADLNRYIAEFEDIAERYCFETFVETEATETHEVTDADLLVLKAPLISIDSFELEGETSTAYDFGDSADKAAGILRLTSCVTGTIEIGYTHGAAKPAIERACVQYVRAVGLRDIADAGRDVISQSFDGGTTRYSTPDWGAGRPTGYIEVDRLLNSAGRALPGIA